MSNYKAGGFPIFIDTNNVWVCLFKSNNPHYGGSLPQMAKGTPDTNEKPFIVALREVHEETGIPLKFLKENEIIPIVSRMFHGETSDYMMHVYAFILNEMYKTSITEEGEGIWFKYQDALNQIRKDQKIFLIMTKQYIDKLS